VRWLASDPLTVSLTDQGGTTLVVVTPCNAVNVPVKVTGSTLDPDVGRMISGAKGCLGAAGEEESWATAFISQAITYAVDGAQLTLTTPSETIVLQRSQS
jgi:hypothetical protein